jgi:ABC-type transport system involved in multi-copper enzyme maturation permease subunit
MWKRFFLFEVRYWLRSWMPWIFLVIISLMIFAAVSTDQVRVGGALENTHRNAPFVIENYYAIMCLLTLLMTTAFVNSAAARDFALNTDQLLFSKPIRKIDYLAGRYLGSALISLIPMLGVSVGVLVAKYMPWVDAERWGPVNFAAHASGILVFAVPNTLFIAAVIFAIAALTRSTAVSFLGALLLLAGYGIAEALTTDIKNETVAAIVDPFAIRAYALSTKYWTMAEKNNQAIGLTGLLLWNRLLWLSAGAAIFALAYFRFTFTHINSSIFSRFTSRVGHGSSLVSEKSPTDSTPGHGSSLVSERSPTYSTPNPSAHLPQFLRIAKTEFRGLVKSTSFIVILAAALLNTVPTLILNASEGFGNRSLPVTYHMVELIEGTLYIFTIAMITYYAGVLVWRERDNRMDEIHDVLPFPEWLAYAAKFVAMMLTLFLIQLTVIVAAVAVQAFSGYHRYQFGLYGSELLAMDFSWFLMLAILAFLCHVLSPNKYIGYFAYIAFLIANTFAWRPLHIATHMVQFGDRPGATYSDFYGYAPFLKGYLWFTAYWISFSALLSVASVLFWQRGAESAWRHRIANARLRFRGPLAVAALLLAVAFVATGSVVFYNTKLLNKVVSENDNLDMAADYEKTYKKFEGLPQPRISQVKYEIDLYPETRNATMRGDEVIRNESAQPIRELHVTVADNLNTEIKLAGATLAKNDERLSYRIYNLGPPLAPDEQRQLQFTVKTDTRGFENTVSHQEIVQNGIFFNNTIAPQIGYQPSRELENKNDRKKRGLKEKDRMPALERNCTANCRNTYLSNNSDWVSVETVISTSPDQIAIAPGSLIREWENQGRRYFQYRLDHDSMNFYSFLSANYEVARDRWNGIQTEVYYLKDHPWNVPRMQQSIRKSLEYYTQNFGPYMHKEARIIEFPRVARFAQAFPGTMPYSESIGFIADLKDPENIDQVFYVVAHEMAHQWWAHQVIGANMQGATLLSETLAQYSALMVMEKEYGRDTMRKFLKYEMDNYLRSRGRELLKERPLLTVEANQGYIHYRKGSVVMYYLREMIGEEAVNRALRKILEQYRYAPAPYPTSYALVDALRAETPPELQYLIKDLFEDITLFSNRTLTAHAKERADGKYDVTVDVEARKFKADDQGNEHETALNDWIEIGAFAAPPKGKKNGQLLHREKVHMTNAKGTYTFTVDQKPDKAGIDPLLLLIDRIPDDNLKSVDVT